MEIEVKDKEKRVNIWLTRAESSALQQNTDPGVGNGEGEADR